MKIYIAMSNSEFFVFRLRAPLTSLQASSTGLKGWAIKYYKGLGTSTSVGEYAPLPWEHN